MLYAYTTAKFYLPGAPVNLKFKLKKSLDRDMPLSVIRQSVALYLISTLATASHPIKSPNRSASSVVEPPTW